MFPEGLPDIEIEDALISALKRDIATQILSREIYRYLAGDLNVSETMNETQAQIDELNAAGTIDELSEIAERLS